MTPAAPRFSFGRLFADTGRVIARAWPLIILDLVVVGGPTIYASAASWWGPVGSGDMLRVWAPITAAKELVQLVGLSLFGALLSLVALRSLDPVEMRGPWAYRAFACGLPTQLLVNLFGNGVSLASPFLLVLWPTMVTRWFVFVLAVVAQCVSALFLLVAVSASIAERRMVFSAIARSARLMRTARWQLMATLFVYLALLWASQSVVVMLLREDTWRMVLNVRLVSALTGGLTLLVAVPGQIVFVSAFLQARRIADGPSARELMDVFA